MSFETQEYQKYLVESINLKKSHTVMLLNHLTSSFKYWKHTGCSCQVSNLYITAFLNYILNQDIMESIVLQLSPVSAQDRSNDSGTLTLDLYTRTLFGVALQCKWPKTTCTFIQLSLQRTIHSIQLGKWRITNIQRELCCHKYPASRWHSNKQTCPFMNKIIPSHRWACSATWP